MRSMMYETEHRMVSHRFIYWFKLVICCVNPYILTRAREISEATIEEQVPVCAQSVLCTVRPFKV